MKPPRPAIDAVTGMVEARRERPLVVAIDGGSGSGKSTIAAAVAQQCDAALVTLDDFFTTRIAEASLADYPVDQRWRHWFESDRVRDEALVPLRAGTVAVWHAFDYARGQVDGRWQRGATPTRVEPKPVVVFEGITSGSTLYADLVDLAVLIDVPYDERMRRRAARGDDDDAWTRLHAASCESYLEQHRGRFDLVVANP